MQNEDENNVSLSFIFIKTLDTFFSQMRSSKYINAMRKDRHTRQHLRRYIKKFSSFFKFISIPGKRIDGHFIYIYIYCFSF